MNIFQERQRVQLAEERRELEDRMRKMEEQMRELDYRNIEQATKKLPDDATRKLEVSDKTTCMHQLYTLYV